MPKSLYREHTNPPIIRLIIASLIGISIGYVLGFYISKYTSNDYFFYLSVLLMGIGCSIVIYGTLFSKKEK